MLPFLPRYLVPRTAEQIHVSARSARIPPHGSVPPLSDMERIFRNLSKSLCYFRRCCRTAHAFYPPGLLQYLRCSLFFRHSRLLGSWRSDFPFPRRRLLVVFNGRMDARQRRGWSSAAYSRQNPSRLTATSFVRDLHRLLYRLPKRHFRFIMLDTAIGSAQPTSELTSSRRFLRTFKQ